MVPADVANDPKGRLIAVSIELHEHPIAHAARILRMSGATPAQVNAGVKLALGKTKPQIALELSISESSVADLTRKLYRTLDVHNSTELGARIWLSAMQDGAPGLMPSRIKPLPSSRGDLAMGAP
jgi:DNA-binding NarL/FixJ family response regulator